LFPANYYMNCLLSMLNFILQAEFCKAAIGEIQRRVLRPKVLGICGNLANLQYSLSDSLTALAALADWGI